jgi:hypothetical protein
MRLIDLNHTHKNKKVILIKNEITHKGKDFKVILKDIAAMTS